MKALKTVFGEIKRHGGADKVPITNQMLNAVKMSGRDAKEAEAKEKARKEKEKAEKVIEQKAAEKRKAEEESKKNWEEKKISLESELTGIQMYIAQKQTIIQESLSKAARLNDPYKVKDIMTTVRLATEDMTKKMEKERDVQEKLRQHMGKKQKTNKN